MNRRPPRLYKNGGLWYLVFYDTETRRRKWLALATKSKDTAERKKKPMERDWYDQTWNPFTEPWVERLSLSGALAEYDRAQTDLSPRSRANVANVGRLLETSLPAGLAVDLVTPSEVRAVVMRCASAAGRTSYKRTLSAFFGWCVEKGYARSNPAAAVKLARKKRALPSFLSYAEASELLEACRTDLHREAVRFALGSGLRLGEVVTLRYANVRDGMIHVKQGKSGERRVPLSEWAERALASAAPGPNPFPFRDQHLSKLTKRAMKDAGLPDAYHFHTLRHTFASWLRLKGVGLDRIRDWLGHRSITTTEIYAHIIPEAVQDEIDAGFPR